MAKKKRKDIPFHIAKKFKLAQTNREYSCDITKIDIEKYQPLIKKLESEGIKFFGIIQTKKSI